MQVLSQLTVNSRNDLDMIDRKEIVRNEDGTKESLVAITLLSSIQDGAAALLYPRN